MTMDRRQLLKSLAAVPVAAAIPFVPATAAPIVPSLLETLRTDIERAIYQTARFEFNDEITRLKVKEAVRPYLNVLQYEKYFHWAFVCNELNNPPEVIDMNDLRADLYLIDSFGKSTVMEFSLLELLPRYHEVGF